MGVRWNDEQLAAVEKLVSKIEALRISLDTSGVNDAVMDSFKDDLPSDLVSAHAEMHHGMSRLRNMVEFQKMLKKGPASNE